MCENEKTPYFSIILPVYGVEKYLNRCVESILNQNFDDYEIILVDDGSKDNSSILCDNWGKKNDRIRCIHKENEGLGFARNTGLELARGKYIFFIDSDDYILPGLLEKVYSETISREVDALFYGFQRVDAQERVRQSVIPTPEKTLYDSNKEIKDELFPNFIARNPHTGHSMNLRISAWSCCLNINFLRNNNLKFVSEREYISEDIYFYVELFNVLKKLIIIPDAYYRYCQNEGSLTFSYKEDRFDRILHFYKCIDQLALKLGYNEETRLRLKQSFISSVMGCLKMEAGQLTKTGIVMSFNRMKRICEEEYFVNAIKDYPVEKYGKTWRIFSMCVKNKHYLFLYLFLLMRFWLKGV